MTFVAMLDRHPPIVSQVH